MLDVILAGAIISGAVYLIYRSIWKKGCYCPGCDSQTCPAKLDRKLANDDFQKNQASPGDDGRFPLSC